MKLLRSEVPAGVGGTLNFTSCESTILHSGIAAASLGKAKLHSIFNSNQFYDIIPMMSDRFRIIKKYIDQMDYYALLAGGAPSNEFDIESKEISALIRDNHSAQDIAEIIALVFNKYFGKHDDATVFLARGRVL